MGDVGNKVPALALRFRQRIRHGIERRGQLADLVAAVGVLHTDVKIAGGIGAGGLHHLLNRLGLAHGGQGAGHKGNEQNNGGGHEEQGNERAPDLHQLHRFHDGHHHADDGGAVFIFRHGNGHNELLIGIDAAQIGTRFVDRMLPENGLHHLVGKGDDLAHNAFIRGQQHIAAAVADQKIHIRHTGRHTRQIAQRVVRLLILLRRDQIRRRHVGHQLGAVLHLAALFLHGIAVAQGIKGYAQQQQRQQHHAGCQQKLLPIQVLKAFFQSFHGRLTLLQTCIRRPKRFSAPTGRKHSPPFRAGA